MNSSFSKILWYVIICLSSFTAFFLATNEFFEIYVYLLNPWLFLLAQIPSFKLLPHSLSVNLAITLFPFLEISAPLFADYSNGLIKIGNAVLLFAMQVIVLRGLFLCFCRRLLSSEEKRRELITLGIAVIGIIITALFTSVYLYYAEQNYKQILQGRKEQAKKDAQILRLVMTETLNPKMCGDISFEDLEVRNACYFVGALKIKNPDICNDMDMPFGSELCRDFVDKIKNHNLSKTSCESIFVKSKTYTYRRCYTESFCENLPLYKERVINNCNFFLGIYFQDPVLCKKSNTWNLASNCSKDIFLE